MSQELIIADGFAPDIFALLQGALVPAIILCRSDDVLQAITAALAGEEIESLHIVAHGCGEGFSLCGQWVDEKALYESAHLLEQWRVKRIALWSCEVGLNGTFIETLAQLTGAEVFASEEYLGCSPVSGERHWCLKNLVNSSVLTSSNVFSQATLLGWDYQLSSLESESDSRNSTGIVRAVADAQEILFIDSAVADKAALIAGTREGVEIVILDAFGDPWQQMTEFITRHQNLMAIHLVSHGSEGAIILAGKVYGSGAEGLQAESIYLSQWQSHLTQDADILLYGCSVAAGSDGQLWIDTLAKITQADVAASTDVTGAAAQGGDWVLEQQTGAIESALPFLDAALAGYGGVMEIATTPMLISSTPSDNASKVTLDSNIVLTFNETVYAGNGSIVITNGVDRRTIDVDDSSQVTFSGTTVTLNPAANLNPASNYHVEIASGAIIDNVGNSYAGISNATTLNFVTSADIVTNGDNGENTLTGDGRNEAIYGYSGNDTINGGGGNDIIYGNGYNVIYHNPVSYSATQGQGSYTDNTGKQLTDRVLGYNSWNVNGAYEWVG